PLLWLLSRSRPRRGFLLGFTFGVAYFGAVLYWVLLFGELGWSALVLASSGFVGVFGLLVPALWRPEHPVLSVVAVSLKKKAIEWLRGMWPVGGFTWGGIGTTQTGDRTLIRLASVTGVWGVSFVVMAVAATILMAWERRASHPGLLLAGVAAIPALILAPGLIPIPRPNGPALEVAAIQVDVRGARGLAPAAEDRAVAAMNVARHLALPRGAVDLAVWGESSLDPGANTPSFRGRVVDAIREVGTPTLAGAVVHAPNGRYYNESLLFDGRGRIVGEYRKVHLVPFGEYVPFRHWLSWISALRRIPYDETPGQRVHPLHVDGLTFGNVICFENSFPAIDRTLVADGAEFLVVTTNNASYEMTAASRQHLLMSQLRAVENARWVVHAAVSGISAFIDPQGRVVDERGLFRPATMLHTIRASSAETLYTRLGDWWAWVSLVLALGLLVVPRAGRPAPPAAPLGERLRTLVILPTFNERETIELVLQRLLALPEPVDVLVVDDSSPDGTAELVRTVAAREPRVRLVERPRKSGLASAYLQGFRLAIQEAYDLVVEMDSDLSHQLELRPGRPLPRRQPLRPPPARLPDPRRHQRVPRLPRSAARAPPRRPKPIRRLRISDRARLSRLARGLRRRRGPDHVPRARARPLQDLPPDRPRGALARDPVGPQGPPRTGPPPPWRTPITDVMESDGAHFLDRRGELLPLALSRGPAT